MGTKRRGIKGGFVRDGAGGAPVGLFLLRAETNRGCLVTWEEKFLLAPALGPPDRSPQPLKSIGNSVLLSRRGLMTFLIPEFPKGPSGPHPADPAVVSFPDSLVPQESSGMRRMLRTSLDPAGKPGASVGCHFPAFPLLLSLLQPPNPGLAPG